MKSKLTTIEKILVIRFRSIGDIILSNPVLKGLRGSFPGSKIHYLVDDVFEDILFNNPHIDKVITHPRSAEKQSIGKQMKSIKLLRQERYDAVVDLQAGPRGALTSLLTGAPIRAGHRFKMRNTICYNKYAKTPEPDCHTWKVQFAIARAIDVPWPKKPEFFLDTKDKNKNSVKLRFKQIGLMLDRPLAVLHPGARIYEKRWPGSKLGLLARWLVDNRGFAVILAGNHNDKDEIEAIRKASGYALPYFTDISLGELVGIINSVDLLVCNDSGPMHIAGALNIPTVAMFGPSDPALWSPIGSRKSLVTPPPMECMPCDQKRCERTGNHCMTHIGIDDVKKAVDQLMTKQGH